MNCLFSLILFLIAVRFFGWGGALVLFFVVPWILKPFALKRMAQTQEHRRVDFLDAFMAAVAKMAKVDGSVSHQEIRAVESILETLHLNAQDAERAKDSFRRAKDSPATFEETIQHFAIHFRSPAMRQVMLAALVQVAISDGAPSSKERELLYLAERFLGLPGLVDALLRESTGGSRYRSAGGSGQYHGSSGGAFRSAESATAEDYALLGLTPSATPDQIRKAYRKKAMDLHPDRIQAKGLPPEMVKIASDQLARVNAAYDTICRTRGIK